VSAAATSGYVALEPGASTWDRCFLVHPLVVVGTTEPDGTPDLAPKHLAGPVSWEAHFGFACAPTHATHRNAVREGCFTVSYPRPEQVLLTSLAAAPRSPDDAKHALAALPTVPARRVRGVLLGEAFLHLECELERVVEGLGPNSLLVGRIVEAQVARDHERDPDEDDADLVAHAPLLAYVHPGRFARIEETFSFPFHEGWRR
jgi:flavin reductase (DIM6/NTAB) family NADH-FMN oxidoreductase RutF